MPVSTARYLPAFVIAWVFCANPSVLYAQPFKAIVPPDREQRDASVTDVYVNDSFEAADAISRAKALASRGAWEDAAERLQNTSDSFADKLVRVEPGHFVGIRAFVNGIIADWPSVGLSAYRSLYENDFRSALTDLGPRPTTRQLLVLFNRYFCLKGTIELGDAIGQTSIEAGDFAVARDVYKRVLRDHPDGRAGAARWRAMLAVVAAMLGEAAPEEAVEGTMRWKGEETPVRAVVDDIRRTFSTKRPAHKLDGRPMFGGSGHRNLKAATDIDELGLRWRVAAFADGATSERASGKPAFDNERERAQQMTAQPVAAGGLIFVQKFRDIAALHANTGVVAWRFRGESAATGALGYLEEQPPGWDSVTIAGGRVFASLPGEALPYYSYESARSPSELVCLDAATGRLVWRLDQELIEESFAEVTFDSSPLIHGGRLMIVGRRRRSFGFEDCYLYCFDAQTGEPLYRTHVGSASTGTFGSRRATRSIAAMHGDDVFVGSNLGTMACVSGSTGAVRWLRLYPRTDESGSGSSRSTRNTRPWHYNPVIWTGGRVAVLPNDGDSFLLLRDDDGALLRSIPRSDLSEIDTVLGIHDETLCGVGREVFCYDLTEDRMRWSRPLPDGAPPLGRGVWADDRLLVPTNRGLSTLAVADGSLRNIEWDLSGAGGNLLALPHQLIVSGAAGLTAYVRRSEILGALRDRMAASPHDPLPALELAEVSLSNAEFAQALSMLDEAMRRAADIAGGLSESLRRRLYDDALMFVDRLESRSLLLPKTLDALYGDAARLAPDPPAHLRYRLRFAKLYETHGRPARSVDLYQQILKDQSLRHLPVDPSGAQPEPASRTAETQVGALLERYGRAIYKPYEDEARATLRRAVAAGDEALLDRIVETFPNSAAAAEALLASGSLRMERGKPRDAAQTFTRAYHGYADRIDRAVVIRKIADAYEQAGSPRSAYRWLTKACREYPSVRFEDGGRVVTFKEYRERLSGVRREVEPSFPHVAAPLGGHFEKTYDEGAFSLLRPRFPYAPGSAWSRAFVRTISGIDAIDIHTGTKTWPTPAAVKGRAKLLLVRPGSAVFATSHEVFALDSSGTRRWSRGTPSRAANEPNADWEDDPVFRAFATDGRRLVTARSDGEVAMILVDSGAVVWAQPQRPIPTNPLTLTDDWVVYHGHEDNGPAVCFVDARTGDFIDAVTIDDKHEIERLFVTIDGRVVVSTSESLTVLDGDTRQALWHKPVRGRIRSASLSLSVDTLVYCEDGRRVKAIRVNDGKPLWESERLAARADDDLQTVLIDGSVIVSSNGSVAAVDLVTGLTLWRGTTPQRVRFAARLPTHAYVIAFDHPEDKSLPSTAYFYDHRNASGIIPKDGGVTDLGVLTDVRAALATDAGLLIQTGSTLSGWIHKRSMSPPDK